MNKYKVTLSTGFVDEVEADRLADRDGAVVFLFNDKEKAVYENVVAMYAPGSWVKIEKVKER